MESRFLLPAILQVCGILVIFAEIVIPSGGLLSIVAAALIFYSLYLVFLISMNAGIFLLFADLIMIPLAIAAGIKLLAVSPVALKTELSEKSGVSTQKPGMENYTGREGMAVTDLHPSGIAIIDGKRLDVVTRGEYVEKSSEIIVLSVAGNRVIVGKKKSDA